MERHCIEAITPCLPRTAGRSVGSTICACSDPRSASVAVIGLSEQFLHRCQHFGIGGITNGVGRRGGLEVVHACAAHLGFLSCAGVSSGRPRAPRIIVIGLFQTRPARSQGAIEVELDPAHPQPIIIKPSGRRGPCHQFERVEPVGIGP